MTSHLIYETFSNPSYAASVKEAHARQVASYEPYRLKKLATDKAKAAIAMACKHRAESAGYYLVKGQSYGCLNDRIRQWYPNIKGEPLNLTGKGAATIPEAWELACYKMDMLLASG